MLIKSKSFALFMASASLTATLSSPVSAMEENANQEKSYFVIAKMVHLPEGGAALEFDPTTATQVRPEIKLEKGQYIIETGSALIKRLTQHEGLNNQVPNISTHRIEAKSKEEEQTKEMVQGLLKEI